jgi:AraC-like DNA-binding protein
MNNSAAPAVLLGKSSSGRASVAAGFVDGMLAGLRRQGRDARPLLAAAGIEPGQRVPVERYAALYNLLNRELDDEGFGLFSQPLRVGSFEFLCRGLLSAAHLEEALQRASRFLRLLLPDLAVSCGRDGEGGWLAIRETRLLAAVRDDAARVFAFEWLLRLLHGLASWLVGRGLLLDAVTFPYAAPAHVDDYALIYTAHSHFDGEQLLARFQANLLDLPVRRDEAALNAFLQGAPGRLTTLYRRDREMVQRVRDALRVALPGSLAQGEVADRLHLSERSLHRRLAAEGTSFRAIKDALRRDLALARLAKSDDSVAQLAASLGYTDASAFYRSVVGWTGLSPSQYRRRLKASGGAG